MSQANDLKNMIEGGESIVYACEQVDVDQMIIEGDVDLAARITQMLVAVEHIVELAKIEY